MVNGKINTRDIVSSIGAGLCLLDRDFHILWVNKHQADWFSDSAQELFGKHCYRIFEKRDHVCRGCPTLKVFKTGCVQHAHRIAVIKSGERRHYELCVSPIKDEKNHVLYALELVQDVTDKIVEQRRNLRIIQRLKYMYRRLSLVNRKLRRNISKLNMVTGQVSRFKSLLKIKYHKKVGELALIKEELTDIFKVNHTLNNDVDFRKVAPLISRFSSELTHADACTLRLLDESRKILTVSASFGFRDKFASQLPLLKVGESLCGKAVELKKTLIAIDVEKDPRIKNPEAVIQEGFRSILCVPMIFQRKVLGVISVFSKRPQHFSKDAIEILGLFASQAAIAVRESKHYDATRKNYYNTVHALVRAIEARDPYTRGHTERVTKYAVKFARLLGMADLDIDILRYASEVHDVGKISIPDFILNKPGRLTPAEKAMIELHPIKGAEMLEPLDFMASAIPIVRHHHERFDGTGYPDGLEKEQIPFMSRIIACADAFDAMTSDRPYRRRKLSIEEAIEEIKNNCGTQFDPYLAHQFIKSLKDYIPPKVVN